MNTDLILEIILFSSIPLVLMIIGGFSGTYIKVNSHFRSFILHLAAGVIFAVVAIEILPDIVGKHSVLPVSIGFLSGLGVMLLIKRITRKSEENHKVELEQYPESAKKKLPFGLLFGIGVDLIIDGFLLGIGFAAGKSEGILLCIALSIELLALGILVATELKTENYSKKSTIYIILVLAMSIIVGAFIGALFLGFLKGNILTLLLSFGLSALMFLVTEELLVEAHHEKDSTLNTTMFFVGFLIFLIIGIID